MAIIRAAARLILREQSRYRFTGPALCLGVPDIYLERRELSVAARPHSRDGGFVDASGFFAAMGITDVTSLDIPGSAHAPDLIHDLNQRLPAELEGRFGLILDPGTTEHVFDVRAALSNVVHALAVGGVVVHFVPIYSYNGGYFSLNPNVLNDFYTVNGFVDLRSYILMWDRYRPYAEKSRVYEYGPLMEPRHALADHDQCRYTPHLLFFARKTRTIGDVAIPIQHEDHSERRARPIGKIVRALLPSSVSTYLIALVKREAQLRRSRRTSFWI